MYTVDIPYGLVQEHLAGRTIYGYTQWVVFKDLVNRVLYYYSYQDTTLKKIEMKKLDLRAGTGMRAIPIESQITVVDVTEHLL
jgi:choloylglycine hydrolase